MSVFQDAFGSQKKTFEVGKDDDEGFHEGFSYHGAETLSSIPRIIQLHVELPIISTKPLSNVGVSALKCFKNIRQDHKAAPRTKKQQHVLSGAVSLGGGWS